MSSCLSVAGLVASSPDQVTTLHDERGEGLREARPRDGRAVVVCARGVEKGRL